MVIHFPILSVTGQVVYDFHIHRSLLLSSHKCLIFLFRFHCPPNFENGKRLVNVKAEEFYFSCFPTAGEGERRFLVRDWHRYLHPFFVKWTTNDHSLSQGLLYVIKMAVRRNFESEGKISSLRFYWLYIRYVKRWRLLPQYLPSRSQLIGCFLYQQHCVCSLKIL